MSGTLAAGPALITGACSEIGQATALSFAKDGCKQLLLADSALEKLQETQKLIAESFSAIEVEIKEADLDNPSSVAELYSRAVEKFGRIDFVVNVADSIQRATLVTEIDEQEFQQSYSTNMRGMFLSEREALRQMLKQSVSKETKSRGSIVNVGSLCATAAIPDTSIYSANKAGFWGLSRSDAFDYGPDMIRVNVVSPGAINTSTGTTIMGNDEATRYKSSIPLRRLGEPDDVASVIVFLASPRAAYVTGTFIPVDGGLNLATGP